MSSYYRATLSTFLATSLDEIFRHLTLGYANDGFREMKSDTPVTWWNDLGELRSAIESIVLTRPAAASWFLLMEFTVPRKGSRLDIVLLDGVNIFLLECKTSEAGNNALRQVERYALLLHYFHKPSHNTRIFPIVITLHPAERAVLRGQLDRALQYELGFDTLASYWIAKTQVLGWSQLPSTIDRLSSATDRIPDGEAWDEGQYRPTPSIIEAALALRTGLQIRDIARSEAAEHEVDAVLDEIRSVIDTSRADHARSICFVTGVPGSGKTLVGLSLAHLSDDHRESIHFMSGNGPLVQVLQEVFRQQAMRDGVRATEALIQAQTLIENVHFFAKQYAEKDKDRAPSNHVIVFDEAQRAWNREQNLRKFQRDYSEPEMLLKIMDRHHDWTCVVALVGGGQEINTGEAGLAEWGKALTESGTPWRVYASPEVLSGGTSTAGQKLFSAGSSAIEVNTREVLHLRTSNRSLRADKLAAWVNHVLDGNDQKAAELRIAEKFPLLLSRDLTQTRRRLAHESLADSRFGLIGSSGSARLRADGLEPSSNFHANYDWHHWYLAGAQDVRSSFRCEVFATEFEVQGLELDWVGLCWGGDLQWTNHGWLPRNLRQGPIAGWNAIKNEDRKRFRMNAYRVLLTRARQGMVIYIPPGDDLDTTRSPRELDATTDFLVRCGVIPIANECSEIQLHRPSL